MKFSRLLIALGMGFILSASGAEKLRERVLPVPLVLAQAQLKYPLNTTQTGYSYYSRWTDWPLFLNAAPKGKKFCSGLLSDQDYVFLCKTLKKYGMDGFSLFLPSRKKIAPSRMLWHDFAALHPEGKLIPMWNPNSHPDSLRLALESPAALKIGGKLPLLFYAAYPEAKRKSLVAELRKRYPGQLLLLLTDPVYGSSFEEKFRRGTVTKKDAEALKENLRRVLRDGDGFYFSRRPRDIQGNGVLYLSFYEYLVRLISEVMAEPEFKGKLLALTAGAEHCNSYNIGYSLVCDGTATLRGFLDIAARYNADIINIPEWDEENENSSLRPTAFKGLTLMRLMRYYTAQNRKQPYTGLPEDSTALPDLAVSFRKMLVPGERFQVELLLLPDSRTAAPCEAEVSLFSADGRKLHTFPPIKMAGDKLQSVKLAVASEKFAGEAVLIPELTIRQKGASWRCRSFGAAALVPTAVNDYEEFHLNVRDVVKAEKEEFTVSALPERQLRVSGEFVFPEPVRYLELLENGRCIWSFQSPGESAWRNDGEYAVLDVSLMSALRQIRCSGTITISSPRGAWKSVQVVPRGLQINGNRAGFRDMLLSNWETRAVAAIPRRELPGCRIEVRIPGFCERDFSFTELLKRGHYALYGRDGFVLSFQRQDRQAVHPPVQDRKVFRVSAAITPERADSVLMFQAVTPGGRQFRSRPVFLGEGQKSPLRTICVYSDTEKRPVKLQLPGIRVPAVDYLFTEEHGTSLPAAAGRYCWASRGGYTLHSTGKGGGATSLYAIGNLPGCGNYPARAVCGMPELRKEPSGNCLYFDGIGNFVTLPQCVIPRRCAYSIELKLCPDPDFSGNCMLIGSATCRGTHGGLRIFLRGGCLCFEFMDKDQKSIRRNTGIRIPNGCWTSLKITRDLTDLIFERNGTVAGKFPCPKPGIFDTLAVLGGSGRGTDYFKGRIGALSIRPYCE